MTASARIVTGRYVDSVVLMRLAQRLAGLPGVNDAAAVMGTDANKALLAEGGFVADGVAGAGPDDLVVAVKAANEAAAAEALGQVEQLLNAPGASAGGFERVRTLEEALVRQPGTNVVVVSVPGGYAAAEARRALEHGLHVFLFSSNVALEDELELKRIATERELLCMGPDCGTAIIGGVGLGFANAVRRGPVGVVGASGSGLQAVTSLLDRFGIGISHAIGAGGRDLSDAVGGATTFAGLRALLDDPGTEAILVVSKPPGPATARRLLAAAVSAAKPVVCCFLDEMTLEEAALAGAASVGRTATVPESPKPEERPPAGRRFVRGLYAGGTLAYEAQLVLQRAGLDVASNAPLPGERSLGKDGRSSGHAVLDLGSEEFTLGRPHPMLDSRARRARLAEEAADPETAVILLDFVLGYGAAADPAGDLTDAIAAARERRIAVVASVCGTEGDPQGLRVQEALLREAGALVLPTNAAAARIAALLVGGAP